MNSTKPTLFDPLTSLSSLHATTTSGHSLLSLVDLSFPLGHPLPSSPEHRRPPPHAAAATPRHQHQPATTISPRLAGSLSPFSLGRVRAVRRQALSPPRPHRPPPCAAVRVIKPCHPHQPIISLSPFPLPSTACKDSRRCSSERRHPHKPFVVSPPHHHHPITTLPHPDCHHRPVTSPVAAEDRRSLPQPPRSRRNTAADFCRTPAIGRPFPAGSTQIEAWELVSNHL